MLELVASLDALLRRRVDVTSTSLVALRCRRIRGRSSARSKAIASGYGWPLRGFFDAPGIVSPPKQTVTQFATFRYGLAYTLALTIEWKRLKLRDLPK